MIQSGIPLSVSACGRVTEGEVLLVIDNPACLA
jgi:hypothetical protein